MNESCLEKILNNDVVIGLLSLENWSSLISLESHSDRSNAFKDSVLTAWNFCLLCWAVDGFDEVMLNPVEGNEVTAMTGWLIT